MTEEEFTEIVERLLEVGVPPTAVAKAFSIDPFIVRERMNDLRVAKYGAAELSEFVQAIQWEALELFRDSLHTAPHAMRQRSIAGILGKTMSLTARQTPETSGIMRAQLMQFMMGKTEDDSLDATDTSAFVAVDESDEDQDQGAPSHSAGLG
jgi:hypothetical protein